MFDAVGAFKKQFSPVEGGYLLYPSRKTGGKLVTSEEYHQLIADWERVSGGGGRWKMVGVTVVVLLLWRLFSPAFSPPAWTNKVVIAAVVVALCARIFWAGHAPRRLVKDRPAVTPPRPLEAAKREARATLDWPFVIFALLFSASIFAGSIATSKRTFSSWAWLIGSGLMLVVYLWVGFRKLTDR